MKRQVFALCLLVTALAAHSGEKPGTETHISEAKQAIQALAGSLQGELKSAMQAGGPVAGIAVCNARASAITAEAAKDGMEIGRVSLRNRNPGNAPNEWQTAVLEDFERQKMEGVPLSSLAWSETADIDGGSEFRFMKAIPTAEVCLKCHGTALAPGVGSVLAELYPQDKATGFSPGDIRGAFVAVKRLPE